MSGAVPPPTARPLERAARVPRPVCPGCGRCGRVDPAPAPQRAPLRAGVARCGGGGRASPGGGAFHRVVRGAWCQALSLPRPPVLWSGQPGFRCACVFVCVLCLTGSGGPASRARSGAPHLFLWPLCLSALLGPLRAGFAPLSLAALAVPRCLGAVPWFFFSASRCLALRALAPRLCLLLGHWLLFGGFSPHPPPFLCLAVLFAPAWCLGVVSFFFFFFFFPSPLRPRCLRLSLVSGPGCPGPRRCAFFALLAFRLSALRALVPLSCFPPGWWLLPVGCCPPLPPFCLAVFVAAARCCVPCAVLCCASLGAVLRHAAARCVLRRCAVLCCVVLAWCRCLLRRALWRCPLPWGPVLCGAAFCGVPPCCVCFVVARWCVLLFAALLCAVCVPGCCAVRSLSSPLCAVLVRSRCAVRVVRAVAGAWCCGVPWCGAGSAGPWLSAGGVFRCRCPCLAAWSVSLRLVWFAVVPCFPVSCSVVLCCRVVLCCCALLSCCGAFGACFALLWAVVLCCVVLLVGCAVFCPVVVAACCGALLLVLCVPCLFRSVRCGALLCWLWCPASLCRVLWRCAVVWCCAVVLCCRFAVLFVFALPSCGPSCGASVVCAVVGASCCGVSLCVVVFPWAFCGVVVLLWCVVVSCCAVRCPVVSCALCRVLRCRAALLGLFLAWVWLYLLEKPLQNFVKYFFFPLFFLFFFFFLFGF